MPPRYTDEKIPDRGGQGGEVGRSFSDAGVSRTQSFSDAGTSSGRVLSMQNAVRGIRGIASGSSSGRWKMISEEELFTGYRPRGRRTPERDEPGAFGELLRMTEDYQVTEEGRRAAFLEQAGRMVSYEEEGAVPNMDYYHAYVGYQEMDVQELHAYFAWRTQLRRGKHVPFLRGFALLHAAELINLIGAESEQEAFDRLLLLMQAGQTGPALLPGRQGLPGRRGNDLQQRIFTESQEDRRCLGKILAGFVLTWGPSEEIVQAYCIPNAAKEAENITLLHYAQSNDAAVWRMIRSLAEHRTVGSAFLEQAGEDAWRVIARVFRRVCRTQQRTGAPVLAQRLLGERRNRVRPLFPGIPYEQRAKEGYRIEVSPATAYYYEKGEWHRSAYPAMRSEEALRELNALVRECERVLRKKTRYRNQLPDRMENPELEKLIAEEYDRWMREKELRSRPEVRVDLSKLDRIRDLAAATRERLLEGTEEGILAEALNAAQADVPAKDVDAAQEDVPVKGVDAAEAGAETGMEHRTEPAARPEAASGTEAQPETAAGFFHAEEHAFLHLLLDGGDGRTYFRDHKVLPSVFIDAINEKAWDEIGDSIVEEDGGGGWCLIGDYLEDVRRLLGEDPNE